MSSPANLILSKLGLFLHWMHSVIIFYLADDTNASRMCHLTTGFSQIRTSPRGLLSPYKVWNPAVVKPVSVAFNHVGASVSPRTPSVAAECHGT